MTEEAVRNFEWDDDGRELSARAAINTAAVRRGHLTGEEALILTIFPPDDEEYAALVAEKVAAMKLRESPAAKHVAKLSQDERRQRERDRYHNDEEYHARRLEQFRKRKHDPAHRERERLRARRQRAATKAAHA
jgi:hypothetical protein